jgi:hypothetical protein
MLNESVRLIHESVRSRLPANKAITRASLDEVELPAALIDYLDALLSREGERIADAIKSRRDPWVSENVDVSRARTALAVAASRNAQVPERDRDAVLGDATSMVTRYLVRPARTLVELIFADDDDELAVEEVADRMELLRSYPYFDDVLKHYFEDKEIKHVDRARLDAVLHRIDRQMTSDFTPEEWTQVMTPLYEMFAVSEEYRAGIPVRILQEYFREKEAGESLERLSRLSPDDLVSSMQLKEILESPMVEPAPEPEPEPLPVAPPKPRPITEAPAQTSEPAGPVPLWKQFQGGGPARPAPEPRRETPVARPSEPAPSGPPAPLWQQFRAGGPEPGRMNTPPPNPEREAPASHSKPEQTPKPVPTRNEPASLADLESDVLGPRGRKNRKMFVRQLFGGDEDEYRQALEGIARSTSWANASQFIAREVFRKHEVNIYDDAAIAFTDLVEERFAHQHRV